MNCLENMRYVQAMNHMPARVNFKNFFTKAWTDKTTLPIPAYITTPQYCNSYARDQALEHNYLQMISPYPSPDTNSGVPQNACVPMR